LKERHGGAGIIFSAKRKCFKAGKRKVKNIPEGGVGAKRRKIGGELRHTVHTLKKVARLSSKERCAVLKTLKKRARKRNNIVNSQQGGDETSKGSSDEAFSHSSVNKEWNHWVVLHGKEKEAVEDVWGIGKALGLQFEGDVYNRFSVLCRAGKGMRGSKNCEVGEGGSLADVGC